MRSLRSVASLRDQAAVETLSLATAFVLQTLVKWPFFWHVRQMASWAGDIIFTEILDVVSFLRSA